MLFFRLQYSRLRFFSIIDTKVDLLRLHDPYINPFLTNIKQKTAASCFFDDLFLHNEDSESNSTILDIGTSIAIPERQFETIAIGAVVPSVTVLTIAVCDLVGLR